MSAACALLGGLRCVGAVLALTGGTGGRASGGLSGEEAGSEDQTGEECSRESSFHIHHPLDWAFGLGQKGSGPSAQIVQHLGVDAHGQIKGNDLTGIWIARG